MLVVDGPSGMASLEWRLSIANCTPFERRGGFSLKRRPVQLIWISSVLL